jgi:hypothetical protein
VIRKSRATVGGLVTIACLLGIVAGCAPRRPANTVSLWYMGSRGGSDYFHQGRSPTEGGNYQLPTGQLDMGETFPLTFDSNQWRRIKKIEEAPEAGTPAPATQPEAR